MSFQLRNNVFLIVISLSKQMYDLSVFKCPQISADVAHFQISGDTQFPVFNFLGSSRSVLQVERGFVGLFEIVGNTGGLMMWHIMDVTIWSTVKQNHGFIHWAHSKLSLLAAGDS